MGERLLSPQQLAEWCDVPLNTIYRWNATGSGPPPRRVGKHVRYRESDCEKWLDAQATRVAQ